MTTEQSPPQYDQPALYDRIQNNTQSSKYVIGNRYDLQINETPQNGYEAEHNEIGQHQRVLTGVGFRAIGDDITTMALEYRKLLPSGQLSSVVHGVKIGTQPNSHLEVSSTLPPGRVIVGMGLRAFEDDITTLRVFHAYWSASDGALTDFRRSDYGKKHDTEAEIRKGEIQDTDVVTGVGVRMLGDDVFWLRLHYGRITLNQRT